MKDLTEHEKAELAAMPPELTAQVAVMYRDVPRHVSVEAPGDTLFQGIPAELFHVVPK
jgi:hypothetical protein